MKTLDEDKAALRKRQAARRAALQAAMPDAGERLASHAPALLSFAERRGMGRDGLPDGLIVAGYWPMRSELDPVPLLSALAAGGAITALPATPQAAQPLVFRRWQAGDALIEGLYGTSEPPPDAAIVIPHLILAPLLAYDADCYRLGYGGGFYDRTLTSIRGERERKVVAVGIAYAGQCVDLLPTGEHDAALDGVLTEAGLTERQEA